MEKKAYQKILEQIEEIRALFIFGQRVVPYLEELILFVKETTPLLLEVNNSILESSNKMPMAVQQLDKVSVTTEMATTDILDGLDRILESLEMTTGMIDEVIEQDEQRIEKEKELILSIAQTLEGEEETRAARVEQALNEYYEKRKRNEPLELMRKNLEKVQSEAYDIMNLLQVQDITTQQIMAANSLIESVQVKLTQLIAKLGTLDISIEHAQERIFDPNAVFEDRSEAQAMADEIMTGESATVHSKKQPEVVVVAEADNVPLGFGTTTPEKTSQDEIDQLFSESKHEES